MADFVEPWSLEGIHRYMAAEDDAHQFSSLLDHVFGYIAACTTLLPLESPCRPEPIEPCTRPCRLRGQSLERSAEAALQRLDWALCPWRWPAPPAAQQLDSVQLCAAVRTLWPAAGRVCLIGARKAAGSGRVVAAQLWA
jgi:hypothetical protein